MPLVSIPDESKGPHTNRLQVCVPVHKSISIAVTNIAECGADVPAGNLKSRAEDLGTYKFGHDDCLADVRSSG